MPREGKRERERKINEQINIYFSAIKIRTIMEVRLQKKGKKWLFTFYRPLPHPFIWESKSGETVRSLTQLVSVNRGHFLLVCVFYKLLVHSSRWEGGPAAWDPSLGKTPALYLIPFCAWPRTGQLSPGPFQSPALLSFASRCIVQSPGTCSHHYRHMWAQVSTHAHDTPTHTHPRQFISH